MNFSEIKLPSNKKFGVFFTVIILLIGIYFLNKEKIIISYIAFIISLVFLLVSIFKASLLLPLNKAWMRLGFIIGVIINPIVLGLIFFLLFVPIALIMRLFRRDELHLRMMNKSSYWKKCKIKKLGTNEFKQQF